MPKGMSEDVSKVVLDALDRGLTRGQISGVVGISKRAITRISSNMKKHGTAKPPPTGAKLGRPVKLTRSQADAMIVWMAERDHTFYVKDLVKFLKEEYRYKGCDGTIRRCLVRAGYRRKLPWHKSEMTVWIPPDYRPVFVTASKNKRPANTAPANANANASREDTQLRAADSEHRAEGSKTGAESEFGLPPVAYHEEQQPRNGIDPALEQHLQPSSQEDHAHLHQSYMQTPYQPATQLDAGPGGAFNYPPQEPTHGHYHQPPTHQQSTLSSQQQGQLQHPQSQAAHVQHQGSPDERSFNASAVPVSNAKARGGRKTGIKASPKQLTALQTELEQKNALIAQLQQQIAQQYGGEQQHSQQALVAQLSPQQQQRQASPRPASHEAVGHSQQSPPINQYHQYQQHY